MAYIYGPNGERYQLIDDSGNTVEDMSLDKLRGDTPLEPGEADLSTHRNQAAAGATNEGVVPDPDPYAEAIKLGRQAMRAGAKEAEGVGAAFASVVRAAANGDRRVVLDNASLQARADAHLG